jgi:tetratricopeptide (TPR) repeat protein
VGALLALLCLTVASPAAFSADKPKTPEISRSIVKDMIAAQKAMQANQWTEVIKNLDAAEAKSGLTPYDEKSINYMRGVADARLNNNKGAQAAFEKVLATGAATPEEKAQVTRALFSIAVNTSQYQKAIEYGKEMVDAGSASPTDQALIAQSYYQLKDCKNSAVWADKAVAATRKAGEVPKENLFLFKLQCASDASDTVGMKAALVELIHLSRKTEYWNNLIRLERQDERDDHNVLMIYRIMYDTKSMNADTDYIEMAQLLGDAGLPGEAASVLQAGLASPVMKDEHKERTNRLLASLKTRADTDQKGIAQLDAEAQKSPGGDLLVKSGEVHYGFGDYQGAVSTINAGIQKGQMKHPDEAYVYLGRSQVQLRNIPDAKKAFAQLKSVPNVSPRVAKLWELYAETIG